MVAECPSFCKKLSLSTVRLVCFLRAPCLKIQKTFYKVNISVENLTKFKKFNNIKDALQIGV